MFILSYNNNGESKFDAHFTVQLNIHKCFGIKQPTVNHINRKVHIWTHRDKNGSIWSTERLKWYMRVPFGCVVVRMISIRCLMAHKKCPYDYMESASRMSSNLIAQYFYQKSNNKSDNYAECWKKRSGDREWKVKPPVDDHKTCKCTE